MFLPQNPLPAAAALLLFLFLAWPRLQSAYGIPAALCCCLLGALYGVALQTTPSAPVAPLPGWMQAGDKVVASGLIRRVESKTDRRLRILLSDVACELENGEIWELPSDLVLTWLYPPIRPVSGERLRTRLRIKPVHNFSNEGSWDIEAYWAKQGVGYRAYLYADREKTTLLPSHTNFMQKLRERIMRLTLRTMGGETRMTQGKALLFALLFGERYFLFSSTADLLSSGSLAHSLALSGLHVGFAFSLGNLAGLLLCLLFPGLMLRIPRKRLCISLGLAVVAPYVWLGNATPSLLRAFLMFAVWTVLLWRGSPRVLLDGLFIALLLLLLVDPQMAFDLRLQLSASAVAGIACFLELRAMVLERFVQIPAATMRARSRTRKLARLARGVLLRLAELLGISLAAQLATLPLVIGSFGEIPLNPLPNLLWLPLLPLALAGEVLALLATALGATYAGSLLMSLAALPLDKGLLFLKQLQNWHLLPTLLCLRPLETAWAGYWGALLCGLLAIRLMLRSNSSNDRPQGTLRPAFILSAVLLFAPALAGLVRLAPELRLTMMDVGQGQAILLETPAGKRLLLDGGGLKSRTFDIGKAILAPALTANHAPELDFVAYSHPDNDHLRGLLYVLARFSISRFATNGCLPRNWNQIPLALILQQKHLRPEIWTAGQKIALEPGLVLEVLHPTLPLDCSDANNVSLCLRLVWKNQGLALLPGDLEHSGLDVLLESGKELASRILVLPHHGASSALCPQLYARVAPVAVLCSAGYLNQFNFPRSEVVKALAVQRIPLYCTAEQGALNVCWKNPASVPEISSVRHGSLAITKADHCKN